MLAPGTPGSQLATELLPTRDPTLDWPLLLSGGVQTLGPGEVAIYKPRWGAFYHTPLEEHLRERDVTTVVFCGCNFPNCPRTSIYEASERDFRVVLARDAISGLYERGERELANIGVRLMSTTEVTGALAAAIRMTSRSPSSSSRETGTDPSMTGGCLCGGVRFALTEPASAAGYCHCTRCQRRTGTAASVQARIDGRTLRLLQGEDLLKVWRHPDGGHEKCFCGKCGAHLFSRSPEDPTQMSVRMGAFDGDPGVRPSWRSYVAYAASWEPIPDDGLERFPEAKPRF